MMSQGVALLVVLLTFPAPRLGAPIPALQRGAEKFEIRGKVINPATGDPVSGALVELAGHWAQFSGPDGEFDFAGVARGQYRLTAKKPGFFNDEQLGRWNASADAMMAVPTNGNVTRNLTPEGVIFGEITNEDGAPQEGVRVEVLGWRMQEGIKRIQVSGRATTDDLGDFRIAELWPGHYYVWFPAVNIHGYSIQQRLAPGRIEKEEGYGPQYYPGVSDRESASLIQIRPGDQVRIAQSLRRQPLFQIKGIVRGASSAQGLNVTAINADGDAMQRKLHIDPETGEFQIDGVPAGSYLLSAAAEERSRPGTPIPMHLLRASLTIHVQGDVSGVVLALGPGIFLGVQVDDEAQRDTNSTDAPMVLVTATPEEFPQFAQSMNATASEPGGQPRFDGLMPGTYRVEARPYGARYVAAMRCGGVDLLREDLTVSPGSALPPIEVILRDDGARLNVTVTENGQPAVAGVVIYPEGYPRQARLVPTDSSGAASVEHLAPGAYQVFALKDPGNLQFHDPEAMESYLDDAASVILSPGGRATVHVEARPEEKSP